MKTILFSSLSLSLLVAISMFIHLSYATTSQPSELVNEVCHQTSNYTFCVESLYSDPHTPSATRIDLAYVAFRFALHNATRNRDHVVQLLENPTADQRPALQRCVADYDKAVSALEEAYGDLDSESYDMLAGLSNQTAQAADDCKAAFTGTSSPLTPINEVFTSLCEICLAVSKQFNIV